MTTFEPTRTNVAARPMPTALDALVVEASVVAPGAVRIGTTSRTINDSKITHAEFLNPDGSLAAVIINEGDETKSINLSDGIHNFTCNVPANGVISCKWNK